MTAARLLALVAVALVGCGCGGASSASSSSPPSSPRAVAAAAPHAPTCRRDDSWRADDRPHDVWRMLRFADQPAYVASDAAERKVIIRHLDTGAVLAEIGVPAPANLDIMPDEVMQTAAGPLLLVTGSMPPKNDGDSAMTTSYWLVQLDADGKAGPAVSVPLPAGYGWESHMVAVGDFRVALLVVPQDPPELDAEPSERAPDDNHLVILDRAGNVVKSSREVGLRTIFAVGQTAFAAASFQGDRTTVRVFDLARLDWVGPATPSDYGIVDTIALGDRAVLLGDHPNPVGDDTREVALATLRATGELSAWQSFDRTAVDARLLPDAMPGTGLVLSAHVEPQHGTTMLVTAVNADLAIARSPGGASPAPGGGLGMISLAFPDALYLASWGIAERLSCAR